jgi:hypothetical protein
VEKKLEPDMPGYMEADGAAPAMAMLWRDRSWVRNTGCGRQGGKGELTPNYMVVAIHTQTIPRRVA